MFVLSNSILMILFLISMHRSSTLDLDKRNQMPTDQWRASLLHADFMSVPSVLGSSSARRGSRSYTRSSSSRSHASGLTRPLDIPHRRSCTTRQYVSSRISDLLPGCGSCSCCRTLRLSFRTASKHAPLFCLLLQNSNRTRSQSRFSGCIVLRRSRPS